MTLRESQRAAMRTISALARLKGFVAYIYKGSGAAAEPMSPLARSGDFYRQRDVFKLARMGNRDCKRLWNDFVAEDPSMARLIIKDVENDRQAAATANQELDGRLREAEQLVAKNRKPRAAKARKKALPAGPRDGLAMWLESSNPAHREMARAALSERHA